MRTMIRISIPVDAGSKGILDGSLPKTLADAMARLKPESAYFYSDRGVRTAIMIVDMKDTSEIPAISEPFFIGMSASVEFIPVMNAEELKAGITKAMAAH
jgi:hypothetical protein